LYYIALCLYIIKTELWW